MGLLGAVLIGVAAALWLTSPSRERLARLAPSHAAAERVLDRRSRSRIASRRRMTVEATRLLAQAPVVADLLGTAIAAGATVPEALVVVSRAMDDPIRSRLASVVTAIELGADPNSAWATWLDEPALSPVAQAIIRSQHSGSPLSVVLDSAAADMRHAYRADVEARARAAGVRAVAPLALCFLPAYLLVGVVPVVAGFARSMFG